MCSSDLVFVVIVIGGIGSIRGAFAGALIVGMVDTLGRAFLKPTLADLVSQAAADAAGVPGTGRTAVRRMTTTIRPEIRAMRISAAPTNRVVSIAGDCSGDVRDSPPAPEAAINAARAAPSRASATNSQTPLTHDSTLAPSAAERK